MRRITASFFLFVYLFANTQLHELVKINAFVSHFAEHKQENKDLTLIGFVKIHYFSGIVLDDDHAEDMKLPFKTIDCSNSTPSHTIPRAVFFALIPAAAVEPAGLPLYDQSALPSAHTADIWQPPKAC